MKHCLDEFMDVLRARTSQRSLTPEWIMFRFGSKSEVEVHRVKAWLEPRGFRMEVPLTTQEAYMMVHDLWPETFDDTVQKACSNALEQGSTCYGEATARHEVWPQERVTSDLTGNLAWEEHAAHLLESPDVADAEQIEDDDAEEQDVVLFNVDQVERAGWARMYVEAWRNCNTALPQARAGAAATHANLFLQHYRDTFDAAEEDEEVDDGL